MSLKKKLLRYVGKKIKSKFDETITKAGFKEEGGGLVTHKGVRGLLPFIVLTAEVIDSKITSGPSESTPTEVNESLVVTTPSVSISTKTDQKLSSSVQSQPMSVIEKSATPLESAYTSVVSGAVQTAPTYSQHMVPHIKKWEGGFVNDPDDTGGATNMGITIKTFRGYYGEERTVEDLKNITEEQWRYIFKKGYWDLAKADRIKNQSVAELIVGWVWGSGPGNAFPPLYRIFNMPTKKHMSEELLEKINSSNQSWLHKQIWEAKKNYFYHICEKRPKNQKFLKGWLRRLDSYVFVPSIYDPEYNAEPTKEPPIVFEQYSSIEDSPYNYRR